VAASRCRFRPGEPTDLNTQLLPPAYAGGTDLDY
jgi:hypothetical protein